MIDPTLYVLRTQAGYVVAPFDADIASRPDRDEPARTPTALLDRIAGHDVSLLLSADGGDVRWAAGETVTHDTLAQMELTSCR